MPTPKTTQNGDNLDAPEAAPRKKDDELLVMARIDRLLGKLPEPARGRVVRWAYDRWDDGRDA